MPLLVLRGDGGAMSVDAFRRRPSFTIGSGPAAGVAAALHQLEISDGIVVECGGTSSNVSVIKSGRPVLRTLRVMGRPTCVRSIDSWVVGAAGGSMARLGRRSARGRRPAERPPRRAPVRVLRDAGGARGCAAGAPSRRAPAIPADYAVICAAGGDFALTATCAANALGLADGAYAAGSRDAASLAFAPLAERLRTTVDEAATRVLDGAARRIADAAAEAAKQHALRDDVPLVALGGSGEALVARVAELLGRPMVRTEHPEVLSSIGAALSLVRVEVDRNGVSALDVPALATEAEAACIAAGRRAGDRSRWRRPTTRRDRILRAVATGAAALETGAVGAEPADDRRRLEAAADALELAPADLTLLAANDFYRVFSENGSGRVAVVDARAAVPVAEDARCVFAGEGTEFLDRLRVRAPTSTRASSASRRCSRGSCSSPARASSTSPTPAGPRTC